MSKQTVKQTYKLKFMDGDTNRTIEYTDSTKAFKAFDDMIKCGLKNVTMIQACYVETDITQLAMLPHTGKEFDMGDAMEAVGVNKK